MKQSHPTLEESRREQRAFVEFFNLDGSDPYFATGVIDGMGLTTRPDWPVWASMTAGQLASAERGIAAGRKVIFDAAKRFAAPARRAAVAIYDGWDQPLSEADRRARLDFAKGQFCPVIDHPRSYASVFLELLFIAVSASVGRHLRYMDVLCYRYY